MRRKSVPKLSNTQRTLDLQVTRTVVEIRLLPSASSRTQQHPLLAAKHKCLHPHLFLKGQIDSILRWGIYLCSENLQGSKSFTIEPLKSYLYRGGTPDRSHTPDQSPTTPGPTCTPSTSPSASSTSPASTFQGSESWNHHWILATMQICSSMFCQSLLDIK